MPAPAYSINFSAHVTGVSGIGSAGDVLIQVGTTAAFVLATTANRGTARSTAIALGAYGNNTSVEVQQNGRASAAITGLGDGAESWLRVSALGRLERCTPADGDDIVGRCDATGNAHLTFGQWDSDNYHGGGGGSGGNGKPNRTATSAHSGGDIGAKINSASAAMLALGGGIVEVDDGDYVLSTRVVLDEGVSLELGYGTISTDLLSTSIPLFLMKDDTSIIGKGPGSKIMTPKRLGTEYFAVAVGDYLSWPDNTHAGNQNLFIKDVQFIANTGSTAFDSQSAAVQVGNVRNAAIENCLFKGVEGYGCFQVGASNHGFHADGFHIRNCIFEDVTTQHAGVLNGRNWSITGCLFRPTASVVGPTLIDCEMNATEDIVENGLISGNIFDISSIGATASASAMVQLVGSDATPYAATGRCKKIVISHNVVVSGDESSANFGYGINLALCDSVTVANNVVGFCPYSIQVGACGSCIIDGNSVQGGGNDSAFPIQLANSTGCYVANNFIHDSTSGAWSIPGITESGTSDYNVYANNRMMFDPPSPGGGGGLDCSVVLLGQHSRVFNTYTGATPVATDAPVAINLTELASLPVPGARHADAPPATFAGGYAAQADGGFSLWKYDAASTATDNGITVIEPDFPAATGRWLRAPQNIKLSAVDRDALVLTADDEGFTIWNTSTKTIDFWDGSAWQVMGTPVPGSFDIADLSWNGLWFDFAASPFVGTASGGTSGAEDLTEGTNPPAVGTTVDGVDAANFDGTNDKLGNAGPVATTFIGTGAWATFVMFKADAAYTSGGDGTRYASPQFWTANDAVVGVGFDDNGIFVHQSNSDPAQKDTNITCATGAWHVLFAWWDGADLHLQLDGGAPITEACTSQFGTVTTATLLVGTDYSEAHFFDGQILEMGIKDTAFGGTEISDIYAALQALYPSAALP